MLSVISPKSNSIMAFRAGKTAFFIAIVNRKRWFSTVSGSNDFAGENAYDILGVSESSSFDEIKASFRKLAKETHPDLLGSHSDPNSSQRFVQILAAYEILSDSEKRAHYDMYIFSQRKVMQKSSRQGSAMYVYESHITVSKQMEVVEWLRWYRYAINDIVSQEKVVAGSGYFDILEGEFYSAVRAAYYGPVIESMDFLPECFEAEERSAYGTSDVLHLVSGRDLFGIVCLANKPPELSQACYEKLTSFTSAGSNMCQSVKSSSISIDFASVDNKETPEMQTRHHKGSMSDVYKDLELHISGRVVAVATRIPPKSCSNGIRNEDTEDHIHVFLSAQECPVYVRTVFSMNSSSGSSFASRILLGTIAGLGTNSEEGSCFVYNNSGTKTHVVMKHRTLLVKHMHWYQVGNEVSVCECRCSRARLPPSKFWLFEPRCHMHDIGGWYIETFGRDKKGRTVPSQRQWDSFDAIEQPEQRLHPAMYLLALAYRTLDLEDAKRRKRTVKNAVEAKLFSILRWCKKLV
ncbi:DnaJ domain [Macleaya cordata]|uniref:DnaJ domain n=1 Tax=Macleaya cordata TaxID=56857 RepID=A0A200R2Y6_MACCD|nr:DnaJ domain [Macleaya cordata]